jgi:hypothetical protein
MGGFSISPEGSVSATFGGLSLSILCTDVTYTEVFNAAKGEAGWKGSEVLRMRLLLCCDG